MKALVLVGGFGTRLRPLTDRVPKSLLPIANVPFLEHQVRLLARHGVDEVVLLTGYLPDDFGPFAQAMARHGITLTVSTEPKPLGTAGAVRSVLDDLDGTVLVLNGDVLTDLDVTGLLARHRDKGAVVTMALAWVDDAMGYGVVPLDDDGRVEAFVQNPKGEPRPGDWINAGVYAMEPEVLARIPADTFADFERGDDPLFPALVADQMPFFGYRAADCYWIDIGTPERYVQANRDVLDGRASFTADGQLMAEDRDLDDGTRIIAPTLLAHAPVGRGAVLGPYTILGQHCRVGANAIVSGSILHPGSQVGDGAEVRDCVLGATAVVEPGARAEGALLA